MGTFEQAEVILALRQRARQHLRAAEECFREVRETLSFDEQCNAMAAFMELGKMVAAPAEQEAPSLENIKQRALKLAGEIGDGHD